MNFALVALGGALGAMARFGISSLVIRCCDVTFPLGTLIANVTGCFLIGLLIGSRIGETMPWCKHHLGIGFLGSLTTFSTFSAETLELFHQNRWSVAGINVALSLTLGLICVALGIALGQKMAGVDAAS
jgi:CrcB protein